MSNLKKVLLYSRKAYSSDKKFKETVEETAKIASSLENHRDLISKRYPKYTIVPLYTYEHSGMCIEKARSCQFDSSADAFGAYLEKEADLDVFIVEINRYLNDEEEENEEDDFINDSDDSDSDYNDNLFYNEMIVDQD